MLTSIRKAIGKAGVDFVEGFIRGWRKHFNDPWDAFPELIQCIQANRFGAEEARLIMETPFGDVIASRLGLSKSDVMRIAMSRRLTWDELESALISGTLSEK